jgi:hypothetical protein
MSLLNEKKFISAGSVLSRNPDMLFNVVDGEVVLLSVENSAYYGLDPTGSYIWHLLENPLSVNAIVDRLLKEYEVPHDQCMEDTLDFLNNLQSKNIIFNSSN